MSHVQRTMGSLRRDGWMVESVERWIPGQGGAPGFRKDLFGIIDLIAVQPGKVLGVQVCDYSTIAAHRRKILEDKPGNTLAWLESGAGLEIWGWKKWEKAVERRKWRPKIEEISVAMLAEP